MPAEIVIVRHGLCTGNAAGQASRNGDHSLFTPELRKQNSREWPLLPLGILQSQEAGKKIRNIIAESFDHYLTSDIPRAIETASHLGFSDSVWETETLLRERSWGGVENLSYPERLKLLNAAGLSDVEDSLEWHPPGGESMLFLLSQMRKFLENARKKFRGGKLLIVSHGGPIQAMRVLQHRVSSDKYASFINGDNYIRNCQIFHYFSTSNECGAMPMYLLERSMLLGKDFKWSETIQKTK